jgi:hypothetical protein
MTPDDKLFELLRDDTEIADLLSAYGEEASAEPTAARERVTTLVEHVGGARLLATLFDFASGFARMTEAIFDFCEAMGVGIKGQVQIATDDVLLPRSALDSAWAFGAGSTWTVAAVERADALASEIGGLVERLDPEEIVHSDSEEVETALGQDLRRSPDPRDQVLREILHDQVYRTERFSACTAADLAALEAVGATIGEAQAAMTGTPLAAGIVSALTELEARCRDVLDHVGAAERITEGNVNPAVATLADEVQILSAQVLALTREVTEAERAEAGFGDFLRTDFWFQRWRIYELWLLVRLISLLRDAGGEVRLQDAEGGLWNLRYGRAAAPVATCIFPEGTIDVFYQLFREKREGADMPDLALIARHGRALAIIDPKHGYSYTRAKVQAVLTRYAETFEADLTAIVNYFPIRSYDFDIANTPQRRWVLASAVAPGGANARRLELLVSDVLLARGYGRALAAHAVPSRPPRQRPARATHLLYWTTTAREVDEPAGAWRLAEGAGATPLAGIGEAVQAVLGSDSVQDIEATADGDACLLVGGGGLVLLASGEGMRKLEGDGWEGRPSWSPRGDRFVAWADDGVRVYSRDGTCQLTVPHPPVRTWRLILGWSADGRSVLCGGEANSRPEVYLLTDRRDWALVLQEQRSYDSSWAILPVEPVGTILRFSSSVLLDEQGTHAIPDGYRDLLSVSPGARYGVFQETRSLRARDGVRLLTIREFGGEGATLPLVRHFGEVAGVPCWSPDLSRFAFVARRRTNSRQVRWEEKLLTARLGDRHALPASLPGQRIAGFAWVSAALLKPYLP